MKTIKPFVFILCVGSATFFSMKGMITHNQEQLSWAIYMMLAAILMELQDK